MIVEIERILPGGVGLAHADGKTIFVSLAVKGDQVRVRIDREQGHLLFATVEEIIRPSSERVEPPCPYFGRCGGCDFQQMNYDAQLASKAEIIRDCFHRLAKIELTDLKVVPSANEWRYRSRATWQVDPVNATMGYYERGSRQVCDVVECAVLIPELQRTLEQVRDSTRPITLKHLDVVVGEEGVSLAPAFSKFQTSELSLKVSNEEYTFNAEAFFQVNHSVLTQLLEFALNDVKGEVALDLYCGVGLFTLPLSRRFKRVIGVESNSVATRFARRNLQNSQLENAAIHTAMLSDWFRSRANNREPVDFVLLDPPRAGAESIVIKGIVDLNPSRICYVSCDPATLARDVKKLIAGGYRLDSIQAFDMFPQTHHVETVVHLQKS
jgi:23S rRNA (uracil1939-C5)-methyltransferase